jgi:phospholipid/cholesterol/gamma-HCH transport system substrate-binding protein
VTGRVRNAAAGALCAMALLGGCDFGGHEPLQPGGAAGYQLEVVFPSLPRGVTRGAPVRIAGVDVGRITAVRRTGSGAVIATTLEARALPVHRDAEVRLRPRLFREGQWFMDLQPGTPGSPELPDGGRIVVRQQQ